MVADVPLDPATGLRTGLPAPADDEELVGWLVTTPSGDRMRLGLDRAAAEAAAVKAGGWIEPMFIKLRGKQR